MPRYVATVSGAGTHAIKDIESGDIVCVFMFRRGGSFRLVMNRLNICLRALNSLDPQSAGDSDDGGR